MIIDTSAWVDYSHNQAGPLGDAVDAALDSGAAMTADIIRLELMAALAAPSRRAMHGVLAGCAFLQQESFVPVLHRDHDFDAIARHTALTARRG